MDTSFLYGRVVSPFPPKLKEPGLPPSPLLAFRFGSSSVFNFFPPNLFLNGGAFCALFLFSLLVFNPRAPTNCAAGSRWLPSLLAGDRPLFRFFCVLSLLTHLQCFFFESFLLSTSVFHYSPPPSAPRASSRSFLLLPPRHSPTRLAPPKTLPQPF